MLKGIFKELLAHYTDNDDLITECWEELERHYRHKKRHYHTLAHLENLYVQLSEVRNEIEDWHCVLFTLYYHDVIYKATRSDNEEKSAELALQRMQQLSVPKAAILRCKNQILATKAHGSSDDQDTNYFTDADLAILGQDWNSYAVYAHNVREEYSIYPDLLYKPGRKKVLLHFLAMERIFKTDHFYAKFEQQAKENMLKELHDL